MIVDRNTLAEFIGLTAGRITQLCHAGVLSKVSRDQYNARQCIQEYINFKMQGGQSGSRDVTEARTALYHAQVHKTELESARIKRETVPADLHLADMLKVQQIFNDSLDDIDPTLPVDLAALSDAATIQARLALATNAIRESVANNIEAFAATVEG